MNGWLRFLIFLGIIVLGICGLIYFWREIFILLKGVLGFIDNPGSGEFMGKNT